jgi:hypothetical protein
MAEVERNWFRPVLGGEPMATIFGADVDWEAAFRDVATADVAEAFRLWQAECDHARALVAAAPSLDVRGFRLRGSASPGEGDPPEPPAAGSACAGCSPT